MVRYLPLSSDKYFTRVSIGAWILDITRTDRFERPLILFSANMKLIWFWKELWNYTKSMFTVKYSFRRYKFGFLQKRVSYQCQILLTNFISCKFFTKFGYRPNFKKTYQYLVFAVEKKLNSFQEYWKTDAALHRYSYEKAFWNMQQIYRRTSMSKCE